MPSWPSFSEPPEVRLDRKPQHRRQLLRLGQNVLEALRGFLLGLDPDEVAIQGVRRGPALRGVQVSKPGLTLGRGGRTLILSHCSQAR